VGTRPRPIAESVPVATDATSVAVRTSFGPYPSYYYFKSTPTNNTNNHIKLSTQANLPTKTKRECIEKIKK
jgi:hypothetical protein